MMNITLYNSETRSKEIFTPREGLPVTLYTCGPTVYNFAHIGNFRAYAFEDVLKRALRYFGLQVKHVMNITDVDDKTIKGAIQDQVSLLQFVEPFKKAFFEDIDTLNIQLAEHYPCATDYISEMIQMIVDLLEKGIAYKSSDQSIYFAIKKFPRYGCLSHFHLDELQEGASDRVAMDEYDKDHISDFVLWKAYDPKRDGEIFWESPWGKGRPGWHLECSAMALNLLGETVDIHVGGIDNLFPHHENEIAQSEAYTNTQFVRCWMHCEHLVVDGKKMSKSLGNYYTLRDILKKGYSGQEIRYMLLHTHYKTQLNFTFQELDAVRVSLQRLNDLIYRLQHIDHESEDTTYSQKLKKGVENFNLALADDLNISSSLAAIFDFVREVNALCDEGKIGLSGSAELLEVLKNFDSVLGVMSFEQEETIPEEIQSLFDLRIQARTEKNWAKSDQFRDEILKKGWLIEDTPKGPRLKKGNLLAT